MKFLLSLGLALTIAIGILGAPAAAQTGWDAAILKVEAAAKKYHAYAVDVGGTSWAGTMYNGWKYDEHRCAILGRMLGKPELISEIETFAYPPMDARSDAHDLLVFSISFENWVAAARWGVSADEHKRINTWNLDCVGRYGIPEAAAMQSDKPNADFEVRDQILLVYGEIDDGFFERFVQVLDANTQVHTVWLGSGGGSVQDAVRSGFEIRERNLDTSLFGNCFSACPLIFVGGNNRTLWASPARLGFHEVSRGGVAVPQNDNIYGLIASYLTLMDVDPVTLIGWMWSASPRHMYEPDVSVLCRPGVATFVQRVCGADWPDGVVP